MEEILKQLTRDANHRLDFLKVEFSNKGRSTFDELLENAADRMVREKRTTQEDIDLAISNINLIINASYKGRERQIGSDKDLISFMVLINSQKGLCPLWPIC